MAKDFIEELERVFESSKEEPEEKIVPREHFLCQILDDSYFSSLLDDVVRTSPTGQEETLDQLMHRVNTTFKSESILFSEFLAHFTRKGCLADGEEPILRPAKPEPSTAQSTVSRKEVDLKKNFDRLLIEKQNKVSNRGKGKFNLTVPDPFF